MAFRFFLVFDPGTEALRSPKERLSQIINKPFLEIADGQEHQTTANMPKLESPDQPTVSAASEGENVLLPNGKTLNTMKKSIDEFNLQHS